MIEFNYIYENNKEKYSLTIWGLDRRHIDDLINMIQEFQKGEEGFTKKILAEKNDFGK